MLILLVFQTEADPLTCCAMVDPQRSEPSMKKSTAAWICWSAVIACFSIALRSLRERSRIPGVLITCQRIYLWSHCPTTRDMLLKAYGWAAVAAVTLSMNEDFPTFTLPQRSRFLAFGSMAGIRDRCCLA